ncbi:hypothetical protein RchiOBHm_Chr5g0008791 [Rosa chinensis]|uniref:Uncharacterized protein n=1 Tax=Rosa chinensis TaxID=74649 RepID=A0A2P6Q462_ROSCH|nr:hypothetical protein RchiOBHm_Chr5g0008791 [Rosa chinensis]
MQIPLQIERSIKTNCLIYLVLEVQSWVAFNRWCRFHLGYLYRFLPSLVNLTSYRCLKTLKLKIIRKYI